MSQDAYNYYDEEQGVRMMSEEELRLLLPAGAGEIDDWWDLAGFAQDTLGLLVSYEGMDGCCVPWYSVG